MYLVCILCIHSIGLGLDYITFDPFCMHCSWSPSTWSRVGYQLNGLCQCIKSTSVMTWHWHWPIYSFPPHLLLLYLITIIVITGGLERYNSHTYRTVFLWFQRRGGDGWGWCYFSAGSNSRCSQVQNSNGSCVPWSYRSGALWDSSYTCSSG